MEFRKVTGLMATTALCSGVAGAAQALPVDPNLACPYLGSDAATALREANYGSGDFTDSTLNPSDLADGTTAVCGMSNNEYADIDFFTFTGLNAGNSIFEVFVESTFFATVEAYATLGSTGSFLPNRLPYEDGGSFTFQTGDAFAGGDVTLGFQFSEQREGNPTGFYAVRLTEADAPAVPLPASAALLGAGLGALGAAGARKRAKRRG